MAAGAGLCTHMVPSMICTPAWSHAGQHAGPDPPWLGPRASPAGCACRAPQLSPPTPRAGPWGGECTPRRCLCPPAVPRSCHTLWGSMVGLCPGKSPLQALDLIREGPRLLQKTGWPRRAPPRPPPAACTHTSRRCGRTQDTEPHGGHGLAHGGAPALSLPLLRKAGWGAAPTQPEAAGLLMIALAGGASTRGHGSHSCGAHHRAEIPGFKAHSWEQPLVVLAAVTPPTQWPLLGRPLTQNRRQLFLCAVRGSRVRSLGINPTMTFARETCLSVGQLRSVVNILLPSCPDACHWSVSRVCCPPPANP